MDPQKDRAVEELAQLNMLHLTGCGDSMCYVYHEKFHRFLPWAPNSILKLHTSAATLPPPPGGGHACTSDDQCQYDGCNDQPCTLGFPSFFGPLDPNMRRVAFGSLRSVSDSLDGLGRCVNDKKISFCYEVAPMYGRVCANDAWINYGSRYVLV